MDERMEVSRRSFLGGLTAAFGYLGLGPATELLARPAGRMRATPRALLEAQQQRAEDYDSLAKLANNENGWGPPESVLQAMTQAFKYANRYGYPDPGLAQAIADLHGVKRENIMFGAGPEKSWTW